jgi:hypothetical protein
MSKSNLVLKIDRPHFTVELYGNVLKIDLKEDAKNEIKEGVEAKSSLGRILGRILNMFAPLHVRLSDIGSVEADNTGNVKIALPHHRDMVIPLEPSDARKLVDKLNELIPAEKEKELERLMEKHKLQRIEKEERELAKEELMTSGPAEMPMPEPRGVRRLEEEAEKETEKEAETRET